MEALPSTTISASQIRSMFKGDSQPISFGQYYKGGTSVTYGSVSHPIVPDSIYTPNVPTSGQLSFSNFRDSRKEYQIELDSDKHQYDLGSDFSSKFTTSGEADKVPILNSNVPFKITIPSDINVWSTSVSTPAFTIPNSLSSNVYTSNVVNNGKIYGQGQTRTQADASTAPGKAMDVQWTGPTYIVNYGEIKGGGGAGGNGGTGGNGGAGRSAIELIASGAGGFNGQNYYYVSVYCYSYYFNNFGYYCRRVEYFTCGGGVGGSHGAVYSGGNGGTGGAGGDASVFTSGADSSLVTAATSGVLGSSGGSGTPGGTGGYGIGSSCSGNINCATTNGASGADGGDSGDGGDGGDGGTGGDFGNSGGTGNDGATGASSTAPGALSLLSSNYCNRGQRYPTNNNVQNYNAQRQSLVNAGTAGSSGTSGESPGDSIYYTVSQDVTVVNSGTILPAI
jgi:hypothetical protein